MASLDIVTSNPSPIKHLFKFLKSFISEINIEFGSEENKTYLKIAELNAEKTIYVNVKLNGNNFEKFQCQQDKMIVGINTHNFNQMFNHIDKDSILKLSHYSHKPTFLEVKMQNQSQQSIFNVKLIDLPKNNIIMPQVMFTTIITLQSKHFYQMCHMFQTDYIKITCYPNKVVFSSVNDNMLFVCNLSGSEQTKINYSENTDAPTFVSGIFEVKHLKHISNNMTLCNDVELYMKNDFPLTIKYNVGSLGRMFIMLTPVINPQNDNDNDDINMQLNDLNINVDEDNIIKQMFNMNINVDKKQQNTQTENDYFVFNITIYTFLIYIISFI
mgnify:CR=1 FL=1